MASVPIVGFVSPPAWYDPTPQEFLRLAGDAVRVQQYVLPLIDFDWRLESVAATEPAQTLAAQALAQTGCDVIACVGTPFGWAGLEDAEAARARCARVSAAAGVQYIATGVAVIDALNAVEAHTVGLACTYYSDDWREGWAGFVAASGFEAHARSLSGQGLAASHGPADETYWAPGPDLISESVARLHSEIPGLDAIVVSGAGARTLNLVDELQQRTGKPVFGSDTALYKALSDRLALGLAI